MNNKIINIIKYVSDNLGKGYNENIYQEGICTELRNNNIQYSKEQIINIYLKEINIGYTRCDILIDNKYIVECKATSTCLNENNFPQLIIYMRELDLEYGILINFNTSPSKSLIEYYCFYNDKKNKKFYVISDNLTKKYTLNNLACIIKDDFDHNLYFHFLNSNDSKSKS